MQEINITAYNLGCFGMFSCYDENCVACLECKVCLECRKLAQERYSKLYNIIEVEEN